MKLQELQANRRLGPSLFAMKIMELNLLALVLFFGLPSARAAESSDQKKRTNINFEDQLVEGELKKPELFYLMQKKQINFGRLIRLRENFIPEMRRSTEDLQRGSRQQ